MPQAKSGHNINGQSGKAQGGSRPRKSAAGKTGKSAVKRTVRKKRKPRKVSLGVWTTVGISASFIPGAHVHIHKKQQCRKLRDRDKGSSGRLALRDRHLASQRREIVGIPFRDDRPARKNNPGPSSCQEHPACQLRVRQGYGRSLDGGQGLQKNWQDAGKSGLRRGAYHFFRSSKDGEAQANCSSRLSAT